MIIQSASSQSPPGWLDDCLQSVRDWASLRGHHYEFVDDAIFDLVPAWYLDKVGDKRPVATDYARLLLIQDALARGYEQAIWLDADVLIFDPDLELASAESCAFGQEVWIQPGQRGHYRAQRNVHNAVCLFRAGCVVLPFLIQTVSSIIQRVDRDKIAPQMVGPKLLGALHSIAGFALLPQVGALSPPVVRDLSQGGGAALDLLRQKSPVPLQAANLCASVVDEAQVARAVEILLRQGSQRPPSPHF